MYKNAGNTVVNTAHTAGSAVILNSFRYMYRVFIKAPQEYILLSKTNHLFLGRKKLHMCVYSLCAGVCHLQTPRWYMCLHRCCDSLPAWFWQAGDSASLSSPDNQRVNMLKQKWVTWMSNWQKSLPSLTRKPLLCAIFAHTLIYKRGDKLIEINAAHICMCFSFQGVKEFTVRPKEWGV